MGANHSELSPMKPEKVASHESDDAPMSQEEEEAKIVKELAPDYVQADDAMHVDFNEDQWLPCIPGLSLSLATIICAVVGAGIGCAIAFSDGKTIMVEETTTTMTNETAEYGDVTDWGAANIDIDVIYMVNGTTMVDYVNTTTKTE